MFSKIPLPRFTGEVCVEFDVTASMLAWVSTPPRARTAGGRLSSAIANLRNSLPEAPGMP